MSADDVITEALRGARDGGISFDDYGEEALIALAEAGYAVVRLPKPNTGSLWEPYLADVRTTPNGRVKIIPDGVEDFDHDPQVVRELAAALLAASKYAEEKR